jgi:hypothetical protein
MFFKKGLKDSTLICNLAMKNSKTSEDMPTIANTYAPVEEETFETRERKKDKKPSHSDQPGTSTSNDKKRKPDCSVANVEWSRHNRTEYRPQLDECKGFLDGICIFQHQGKHKTRDCNKL